jgi:hypothetical protein
MSGAQGLSPATFRRRLRWLAWVGFALYVVFLCAAPFEHHDLSCELKTPQHCTACTSSVLSASPDTPAVPGQWNLIDVGSAVTLDARADSILLAVRTTGRSPPSAA